MFCPSCGSTNSTDQRFCRSCGMNLEPAAESLREQFPTGNRPDLDRREQRIERFGQIAFGGFMIVIVLAALGMIYTILDRIIFSGDSPLFGLGLMGFIIFGLLTLVYVFFREDLKEKRKKSAPATAPELQRPAVTGRLIEERDFEPVPTVTESTTELLPSRNRER